MYEIDFVNKAFPVHFPEFERWMRSQGGSNYIGMSVDHDVTLHFSARPLDNTIAQVNQYWDSMTQAGEAARKKTDDDRASATAMATDAILSMPWDAMSPAERKISMRMQLTLSDQDALVKKYGSNS